MIFILLSILLSFFATFVLIKKGVPKILQIFPMAQFLPIGLEFFAMVCFFINTSLGGLVGTTSFFFSGIITAWYFTDFNFKRQIKLNPTKDSFVFGTEKGGIQVDNVYRGNGVFGGAGSGKSESIIKPFIRQCAIKGFAGVLYDFKSPELINYTKQAYNIESNGSVQLKTIDFQNIYNSERVNPIAYVNSSIDATQLADSLLMNLNKEYIKKQDFWSQSIKSILSGGIWFFRKNRPELATLPHLFTFFFECTAVELVYILSQDIEVKGQISSLKEAVDNNAEKQVAGVLGTLKTLIGIYNNPQFHWQFSADNVNLNVNDPRNKTMLLIGNDSTKGGVYAPLISSILTVVSNQMNRPNKADSAIIIDEMPTIFIPNFEQIPATARSNRVAVMIGAQDIAQMTDAYGREKAQVLLSNLGNQWFGRTTNRETAEHVSKLFGKERVLTKMKSHTSGGENSTTTKSKQIEHLENIKVQDMTNLRAGEFATLIAQGIKQDHIDRYEQAKNYNIPMTAPSGGTYSDAVMVQINEDMKRFLAPYRRSTQQDK